jgi:maltose O-acetyltransferase
MIDSRHWATLTRNAHRWSRQARMSAYRRLLGALLGDMAPTVKPYGFPTVTFPERIRIGAGTTINYGVVLGGRGGIDIGRRVKLSSRCVLETQFVDPFSGGKSHHEARPIIVEDDVDVGVGALILAGVRVGKRSVIGAGSVVLSDVPADSLAIGVPATVVPLRMASHDAMPSQRPRQPVDEEQIMRRIVRWVREVVDVEVHADSPLRGEVLGSLECVELITVLEATFGIDVDGVLGPQALASAATLAKLVAEQARTGRLDWHQQPPTATALHASDVLSRVRTLPPGSVAARVDARTLVVGTPKTTTEAGRGIVGRRRAVVRGPTLRAGSEVERGTGLVPAVAGAR